MLISNSSPDIPIIAGYKAQTEKCDFQLYTGCRKLNYSQLLFGYSWYKLETKDFLKAYANGSLFLVRTSIATILVITHDHKIKHNNRVIDP